MVGTRPKTLPTHEDKSENEVMGAQLLALQRDMAAMREALRFATGRAYAPMRESLRCSACGGTNLVHGPRVLDRAESGREALSLVQPSIWSARGISELELYPGTIEADGEKLRLIDGTRGDGAPFRS